MIAFDVSDQYEYALDIIIAFNNAIVEYKGSDQTGKDIKDLWSELDKLSGPIQDLMDNHNQMVEEVAEDVKEAWEASIVADVDEGTVH